MNNILYIVVRFFCLWRHLYVRPWTYWTIQHMLHSCQLGLDNWFVLMPQRFDTSTLTVQKYKYWTTKLYVYHFSLNIFFSKCRLIKHHYLVSFFTFIFIQHCIKCIKYLKVLQYLFYQLIICMILFIHYYYMYLVRLCCISYRHWKGSTNENRGLSNAKWISHKNWAREFTFGWGNG